MTADRWNHFGFSASIASAGTAASSKPLGAMGVTLGLGLLKEIYDEVCGSGFQREDLVADLAGTLLGGIAAADICMEDFP